MALLNATVALMCVPHRCSADVGSSFPACQDPELAWGFWARCYQAYTRATPHAGYSLIHSWARSKACGYFVVTSNVDGHWLRSGVPEGRVWEVHGSAVHLQPCEKPMDGWAKDWRQDWRDDAEADETGDEADQPDVWPQVWVADPKAMTSVVLPEWKLAPRQVVQVQLAWGGQWSEATVAHDGKTLYSQGTAVNPYGLRVHAQAHDLLRPVPGGVLPSTPSCSAAAPAYSLQADGSRASSELANTANLAAKSLARPNVLMFSDGAFNSARADQQRQVYYDWHESLPSDVRLVVLEVGVGTAVQKIRGMAEIAAQAFEQSTLIRINLADVQHVCDGTEELEEDGRLIRVPMGALAALQEIDRLMSL